MSEHMLHILGPSRRDEVAAIVGDRPALLALREAVETALISGAGGTPAYQSDGECYFLAVALQPNMDNVFTSYTEDTTKMRSQREKTPLRAVPNFWRALSKAMRAARLPDLELPMSPVIDDGSAVG